MSIQEKYDDAYKNAKNLKGGDQQDQLDVRPIILQFTTRNLGLIFILSSSTAGPK